MAILNGGRILKQATPSSARLELQGRIWTKIIDREDLEAHEAQYNLLSSNYNEDNTLNIRVFNDSQPSEDFKPVEPQLDDVYFIALKQDEPVTAV
jgi:hypothetical protein